MKSSRRRQIEEDDDRRIADGSVMAGEGQAARFAVHAKDGDVVAALVAGVEEPAGGVAVEAARVVPTRPFLAHEGQPAVFADSEDPNAVVQAVARIDEPAISGNQYLGAEIAAGESGRQAGDGLPRCEPSRPGIVIEQDDVRAFFLNGIEPTSIRVEVEMPRPVSRRQRDGGRIVRRRAAAFPLPPQWTLALFDSGGRLEYRPVPLRCCEGTPGSAANNLQPAAWIRRQQFLLGDPGFRRWPVRLCGQPPARQHWDLFGR